MIPYKKNPRRQLEKFSKIFLQIGLVLTLFVVHVIIEQVVSEKKPIRVMHKEFDFNVYEFEPMPFERLEKPLQKVAQKQQLQKKVILETLKKGNPPRPPLKIISSEKKNVASSIQPDTVDESKTVEEPLKLAKTVYDYRMATPLFKGCKDISKKENRSCFDRKMKKFVLRKFDPSISDGLNLVSGDYKIFAEFIINKSGHVEHIRVRAPHPRMQKEVEQMIKKLPQFTPGKIGDKNVKVKYLLPIRFEID